MLMRNGGMFGRARRALPLLLAAVLLFGCTPQASEPADAATPTPATAAPGLPDATPAPGEPQAPSDEDEAFSAFSPIITLSTIRVIDPVRVYPGDNTWDNNVWTRAYEEMLGIRFTYKWTGEEHQLAAAVEALAAAGDLPDYMVLPYDSFYPLASSGMLEPLDGALDRYASESVREALDLYGGAARSAASVRGQLYGITSAPPMDGVMLWYRDDWMEAAGAEKPATFADLLDLIDIFSSDPMGTGNPTQGIALTGALFSGEHGYPSGLDGFFSAYGAYPTQWQEYSGELIHGSTHNGVRAALQQLQAMYAGGVIAQDFLSMDPWTDLLQSIYAGEVGLALGPSWFVEWIENNRGMNPRTEDTETWSCMPIPGMAGAANQVPTAARAGDVTCVREGFAYPEAAVRMVNLTRRLLDEETEQPQFTSIAVESANYPTSFLAMAEGGGVSDGRRSEYAAKVAGALNGGENQLDGNARLLYLRCMAWLEGQDMSAYGIYSQYGPDGSQATLADMRARSLLRPDAYSGPTTAGIARDWTVLSQARDDTYASIIMGADVDRTFEEYIRIFAENGGREITREVNDWFAAQ